MQDTSVSETAAVDAPAAAPTSHVVLSVDAMGGDLGPAAVVAGVAKVAQSMSDVQFLLHGRSLDLTRLVQRYKLEDRVTIRPCDGVVTMDDRPSQVMRHGEGTSMWSAIEAVRSGEATVVVSCGNTGALMALSVLRLRRLPGVNRPAIACLWPSRNPAGFNVMLDVGADVKAEANDLLQYALMGVSYARNGLDVARPRVGVMNVGTEEHKGRAELRQALDMISDVAEAGQFDCVGFVEGSDLPSDRVDVIVTDGFTGNVALKTGEGTARLVADMLRASYKATPLSRLAALVSLGVIRRLRKRMDPRRVNGGVFLGLNGTVVKSHGASDGTGVAAALELAVQLARSEFSTRLAARVAGAADAMAAAAAKAAAGTGK
ncbi:phosphate acyltransferase PlsX [Phaeovulum vinaykumarii]|uniref:Phosphate acyltransferase n=1 Tax=Phaeovulum vinaykumarii TaxID=407234 RepID=A0A1N7JPZ8_9RHOB|nr:phosphate acyltransferase PlsX [Phaeovulum vinaykumarii]SIS51331.1 phosphate:acyl-[acyl carrier protein] acyltransferase [Phaeovulum vinaykumarii]SOB90691.1 phosphate:acyl-[acyl carrier protein] acyltransferase [Phaeovulum vinaykumarii]